MHEEDYGISWKHTDFRTEEVEVRRSRRLVISMICTVGNYEYGFFWYFYNDASIEVEVKLSGVLTTGAVADGEEPRWGKLVAPGIYGPNHQHFFNFRLDMSVDGAGNSVYEVDSIPEPDPSAEPAPQRVDHPGHAGRVGGRGCPGLGLEDRPLLEGHQPVEEERTRQPGGVQADADARSCR